ncbi:excisionase family DNA binding protein [Granulicella aggregans]|uniref:Excisionase family DNA binding protein n=1 Tax=Granulicella aggregans TaxID=474949 RepID=A0A7W7ZJA0_9BACT|nr:helix-turn-helix domain-containing protein [Granulicella aggregans]MBB5060206.1 excisionase family DNA binding protein [Granulicella aggregans]
MSPIAVLTPEIPTEAEALVAGATKDIFAPRLGTLSTFDLKAVNFASEATVRIPASAARLLVQILDEMSRGNAVKIVPVHAELTTQEAADLLNVSRPTLIQMLEEGKIPFRKVGTHRRIRTEKLMGYKRQLEADRRAALAELVAYDQELGL